MVGVAMHMLHLLPRTALTYDVKILLLHPQIPGRVVVWRLSASWTRMCCMGCHGYVANCENKANCLVYNINKLFSRILSNMSSSKLKSPTGAKLYSECFNLTCLKTSAIKLARLYGLNLIVGRETEPDGNCMISFPADQLKMRFHFLY